VVEGGVGRRGSGTLSTFKDGQSSDVTNRRHPGKFNKATSPWSAIRHAPLYGCSHLPVHYRNEEAKDFKLSSRSTIHRRMRPGLSTTAKITTAQKASVLSLPIQALDDARPQ